MEGLITALGTWKEGKGIIFTPVPSCPGLPLSIVLAPVAHLYPCLRGRYLPCTKDFSRATSSSSPSSALPIFVRWAQRGSESCFERARQSSVGPRRLQSSRLELRFSQQAAGCRNASLLMGTGQSPTLTVCMARFQCVLIAAGLKKGMEVLSGVQGQASPTAECCQEHTGMRGCTRSQVPAAGQGGACKPRGVQRWC